jgi:hypothetical protein
MSIRLPVFARSATSNAKTTAKIPNAMITVFIVSLRLVAGSYHPPSYEQGFGRDKR